MIKFNELRVDSKSKKLIIDTSVLDLDYYTDVYIKKIYIHTQDTINAIDPTTSLDNAVYTSAEYASDTKNVKLVLDGTDRTDGSLEKIDMTTTIFFVIVECGGTPASTTPCGMDSVYTMGVTIDMCPIYNNILKYIGELGDSCSVPQYLIDSYLQFKAFLVAVDTEHYLAAIDYYKRFFTNVSLGITIKCNCNG